MAFQNNRIEREKIARNELVSILFSIKGVITETRVIHTFGNSCVVHVNASAEGFHVRKSVYS